MIKDISEWISLLMSDFLTQEVTEKSDKYTGQVLTARQKQNYSEKSLLISTVTDVNVKEWVMGRGVWGGHQV